MGYVFDREAARRYSAWSRSPHGRAMDRWLESCLPGLLACRPGERVLDVGCGEGTHLLMLKNLGLDISGVDASPHMIERARERLGRRCALETGSAEDLPYEDNRYDLCTLIHTLEFVESPLEALREAARVARRAVFVCAMNSVSWNGVLRKLKPGSLPAPFDEGRFFSLWGLQGLVRGTLGSVPTVWLSAPVLPAGFTRWCRRMTGRRLQPPLPFGPCLGLCATIRYRFRTDNLVLKLPVRPRRQAVPHGVGMGHLETLHGANRHERSHPV